MDDINSLEFGYLKHFYCVELIVSAIWLHQRLAATLSFLTGNEIETENFFTNAASRIDDKIIAVFLIGFFASLVNSLFLVNQETGNLFQGLFDFDFLYC